MHFQSEKQKSCVYYSNFSIWPVVHPALSTYNIEFVALVVGTMNLVEWEFLLTAQVVVV